MTIMMMLMRMMIDNVDIDNDGDDQLFKQTMQLKFPGNVTMCMYDDVDDDINDDYDDNNDDDEKSPESQRQ